jgi:hypothetical protein
MENQLERRWQSRLRGRKKPDRSMNLQVRVVMALALLCAVAAPVLETAYAEEIDFGKIDKFESLATVITSAGRFSPLGPLGIVVSALVFPRQFIKRRLVTTGAIAIFWHVKLLVLVVFDVGAILIAPAFSFSINSARFHN